MPSIQRVVGTWDGASTSTDLGDAWSQLFAFDGGVLSAGETMSWSADGQTWTELTNPFGNGHGRNLLLSSGDTIINFGSSDRNEPLEPYALDVSSSTWVPVAGPSLPAGSVPQFGESMHGATLYSVEPVWEPEPFEHSASVELGAYTYTQTITESGESYVLVDTATGGVVVEEAFDYDDAFYGPDGPYEYFEYEPFGGFTINDPTTGEVLVEIDDVQARDFYDELYSYEFEEANYPEPPMFSEIRVLATNGESWIDAPLEMSFETMEAPPMPATTVVVDDGEEPAEAPVEEMMEEWIEPTAWPDSIAANDSVVLVGMSDGTYQLFEF